VDDNPSDWTSMKGGAFAKATIAKATTREKRPLYRALPPALDFPLDALGPLKHVALAIHYCTQAPFAICAQSVLAAATLAIQAHRDVLLPSGRKPLTGLFVSIAESGERKSSVDRLALEPVHRVEAEWAKQTTEDNLAHKIEEKTWSVSQEHAAKTNKDDPVKLRAALFEIGPQPAPPLNAMVTFSDTTPEALVMHFTKGRPFAGLFTAEGGILIGGAAFTDESKMRTAALLNILWDGDPITRKRIGTGDTYLPGRRCTIHIMLQQVIADELFGKNLLIGIGFIARMLLVAPESTAGTRFFREPPVWTTEVLRNYNDRIRELLTRPPTMRTDDPNALDPPAMILSPDAKREWIVFHDECERAVLPDGHMVRIRAFAGKLAEHAGRLAAMLTVYKYPDAKEVPQIAMRSGIVLAKHYASEMIRLADGASIPYDLRQAQRLLTWWQLQGPSPLYLSKIYQLGPPDLRNARAARAATEILEEHGWVAKLPAGTEVDGKPRKEVWGLIL
jgi:hypothetical protein